MERDRSPAPAIALFYFAFVGSLGLFLPFFPLYLERLGLAPTAITATTALGPAMGLIAPPLVGLLADALRRRIWVLRAISVGACLAFAAFLLAGPHRVALTVAIAAFSFFRSPLWALTDAAALEAVRVHGGSYGRVRVWGSIGFLGAVLGGGALLERAGPAAVMSACGAGLLGAAGCAFRLPAPPPPSRRSVLATWLELLRGRDVWLFLLAVAVGQMGAAAYDSCYSLHLARLGLGGGATGGLWAIGVSAEIALLHWSLPLLERFGPYRMLIFAYATGVVRWGLIAHATHPAVLVALQPLHAITFGVYYVAAVSIVRDRAAPEVATAAQGLLGAATAVGSVIGMPLAGALLERGGGRATFQGAAALAALATALAAGFASARRRA